MMITKFAPLFLLSTLLSIGIASAQSESVNVLRQPATLGQGFEYNDYLYYTPRSDTTATAAPIVSAPSLPATYTLSEEPRPLGRELKIELDAIELDGIGDVDLCGEFEDCGGDDCGTDSPWRIPQPSLLSQRDIAVGGWIQQGVTLNAWNPPSRFNGPLLTNDRHGEYQLNQTWLYLERPADTGGCGFAVGGRIDMFYGSDYRTTASTGLEDQINGDNQENGLALPQAYLEVAYNDLSVKLGHMTGILGYEVVPSVGNFFYSHNFGLYYSQPIVVTGAMAKYRLNRRWTLQGGIHRGNNTWEDNNTDFDFMGGATWTSCNELTSLAFALSSGAQDAAGQLNRTVYSMVLKHQLTDPLLFVLTHDYGTQDGAAAGRSAQWYGFGQYMIYTFNPCWSAGLRAEWWRDDDGANIAGLGNLPGIRGWAGGPGFAGDFTEVTAGINWRPHPNIIVRPELRWDWYNGAQAAGQWPFDDGGHDHQFTLATDLIVTF